MNQTSNHTQLSTIYLAGGCFWGIQQLTKGLPGVTDTRGIYFVPVEDMEKEGYGYLLEE